MRSADAGYSEADLVVDNCALGTPRGVSHGEPSDCLPLEGPWFRLPVSESGDSLLAQQVSRERSPWPIWMECTDYLLLHVYEANAGVIP
jgi:hypothetical protein